MADRRGVVTVVIISVVMLGTITGGIVCAITERDRVPVARPAPAPDAAPALPPAVEAKLAVYREFLAEVDGTLHALRLAWHAQHATYLDWTWPVWLTHAQLDARLEAIAALAGTPPVVAEVDRAAARYVEVVRAERPVWVAAVEAWNAGAEAYAPASAPIRDSFERFGAASVALRAAVPSPSTVPADRTWAHVEEACFVALDAMALAAPPGTVEVEASRASMYTPPPPEVFRAFGVRCARAAVDLLEHATGPEASRAQDAVRMGLALITEAERREHVQGAYVTALGNYAQLVAYTVRRPR